MTSRKLTAGGEVVAYCTKCRMDLNHRIVALVDGIPVKVELTAAEITANIHDTDRRWNVPHISGRRREQHVGSVNQ